ncbi:unnamed protein product, partial [Polarella glacialis]
EVPKDFPKDLAGPATGPASPAAPLRAVQPPRRHMSADSSNAFNAVGGSETGSSQGSYDSWRRTRESGRGGGYPSINEKAHAAEVSASKLSTLRSVYRKSDALAEHQPEHKRTLQHSSSTPTTQKEKLPQLPSPCRSGEDSPSSGMRRSRSAAALRAAAAGAATSPRPRSDRGRIEGGRRPADRLGGGIITSQSTSALL